MTFNEINVVIQEQNILAKCDIKINERLLVV